MAAQVFDQDSEGKKCNIITNSPTVGERESKKKSETDEQKTRAIVSKLHGAFSAYATLATKVVRTNKVHFL